MKETVFNVTGKKLFDEFRKLDSEIRELYEAAEMVKVNVGAGSSAYRLLKEQLENKREELQRKERQQYSYKIVELDGFAVQSKGGHF